MKKETHIRAYVDVVDQIKVIQKREKLASIEDALLWIMKRLANLEQLYNIVQDNADKMSAEVKVTYTREEYLKDLEANRKKWQNDEEAIFIVKKERKTNE